MSTSEHRARVHWADDGNVFDAEHLSRAHLVTFGGGATMAASSAPNYHGDASRVNPEELLAAALASCHMLTFLVVAAKRRKRVLAYEDEATATVGVDDEGRTGVTSIRLAPRVKFAEPSPTAEELAKLHELAHKNCFIARAIKASVTIVPEDPSEAPTA